MQARRVGEERTLLLLEDDAALSDVMAAALASRGYAVQVCRSSAEARQLLDSQPAPDCALMDLRLPDGSGLGLVGALRKLNSNATIVVLTGFANIATAIEAIKLGANDYLCKPVSVEVITAALDGRNVLEYLTATMPPPEIQHEHIQRVLCENQSNISATARALGMHRRTLQRKLARDSGA